MRRVMSGNPPHLSTVSAFSGMIRRAPVTCKRAKSDWRRTRAYSSETELESSPEDGPSVKRLQVSETDGISSRG